MDRIAGSTYDANGNTLTSGARSFGWDSQNRLISAAGITMAYDDDGNRVAKGATQHLVDDNNPTGLPQVVEELTGGNVVRSYTYGLDRISQRHFISGTWQTSFYSHDAHGDVRFLMDPVGAVTDTYDFDAWGNVVNQTGSTPNVFRYQGDQFDSETGLYYLRARYFDPLAGRFLSVDPLAGQGERPYLYTGADPENRADPTGRKAGLLIFDPFAANGGYLAYMPGLLRWCPTCEFPVKTRPVEYPVLVEFAVHSYIWAQRISGDWEIIEGWPHVKWLAGTVYPDALAGQHGDYPRLNGTWWYSPRNEFTCADVACLEREALSYPVQLYKPLLHNSNTLVHSILRKCRFDVPSPPGAYGWW